LIYFSLRIYSEHYLLPAYAFFIPGLAYLIECGYLRQGIGRVSLIISLIFFGISSIPHGMYVWSINKQGAINFQQTVFQTASALKEGSIKNRLCFDKVDVLQGGEVYHSFSKYLAHTDKKLNFEICQNYVDQKDEIPYCSLDKGFSGLIIHTPYSLRPQVQLESSSLEKNKCSLIYQSESPGLQDYSLRYWIRFLPGISSMAKNFGNQNSSYAVFRCLNQEINR
jgi:hypothetical protein